MRMGAQVHKQKWGGKWKKDQRIVCISSSVDTPPELRFASIVVEYIYTGACQS